MNGRGENLPVITVELCGEWARHGLQQRRAAANAHLESSVINHHRERWSAQKHVLIPIVRELALSWILLLQARVAHNELNASHCKIHRVDSVDDSFDLLYLVDKS